MLKVGCGSYFSEEPLGADGGCELGAEDFDRDIAVVTDVVREVDCCHPARANFTLDAIAVRQCGWEAVVRAHNRFTILVVGTSFRVAAATDGHEHSQEREKTLANPVRG